jgi:hypothetical protein
MGVLKIMIFLGRLLTLNGDVEETGRIHAENYP